MVEPAGTGLRPRIASPWLALTAGAGLLLLGVGVSGHLGAAWGYALFAAVFSKVQPMVFGETTAKRLPVRPAMIPVYVHLGLVLMLGLWIPPFLADWYRQAARLIG